MLQPFTAVTRGLQNNSARSFVQAAAISVQLMLLTVPLTTVMFIGVP
jgi:hypothetical protein